MAGLIEELKRRNVFKVGTAYVVLSWLLAQAADLAADTFAAPDWVMKMLVTMLFLAFPLVLFFAWAYELTPEGIKKEKDVDRSQSITHKTGRKLDFTIIGILLLALGYFIWESRFESKDAQPAQDSIITSDAGMPTAESESPSSEVATTVNPKSIAVLPFVNMSDDASNEYFSDGISEEILNALAKVRELKVAGRTSSFAFKGQAQDIREIGETLGVAHILEGSVRKSGDTVRITAQLIQVDDGFHLWSESYDRELVDVFAIQDEIASAILTELKTALLDGEIQPVNSERTNSEAYDLYLLARQRLYERKSLSIESAIDLLDQALVLDPGYAPAYAQRGIATLLFSDQNYGTRPLQEAREEARGFIDKALQLDPDQAEAWAGLGLYYSQGINQYEQAIESLEKALAINPSLIDASNWLQNAYNNTGRSTESLQVLDDMIARDPLYPPAIGNAVNLKNAIGDFQGAQSVIDRAKPYMPDDFLLARSEANIFFYQGDYAKGLPELEAAMRQQPDHAVVRGEVGWGLYMTHQYERAAEIDDRFFEVLAMARLGRLEEARILAEEQDEQGVFITLATLLNQTGQSRELVRLYDSRWSSLAEFEADTPAAGLFGYWEMLELAYAFKQVGRSEQFADAMQRLRAAQEKQLAAGADNFFFDFIEAGYYTLAGDFDEAINRFAKSVDRGMTMASRVSEEYPYLEPLEGDPRFEAARLKMMEHINRERAALGLEQVEA